jgi:hypothetical membrane protein
MNARRTAGITGIAGVLVLLICAAVSAVTFEDGAFSPANRFISELGLYYHGYFTVSPALLFNTGMVASGLLLCVFAVSRGIYRDMPLDTAAGFFGILTGVSLIAQGLVTLNYMEYHLIISAIFFASVFLMCVFTVISQIRLRGSSLAVLIIAFLAGAAGALCSVYILSGGLEGRLGAGASYAQRADVMPCAILQWAVYALLVLLFLVEAVILLASRREAEDVFESGPAGGNRWHGKHDIDI